MEIHVAFRQWQIKLSYSYFIQCNIPSISSYNIGFIFSDRTKMKHVTFSDSYCQCIKLLTAKCVRRNICKKHKAIGSSTRYVSWCSMTTELNSGVECLNFHFVVILLRIILWCHDLEWYCILSWGLLHFGLEYENFDESYKSQHKTCENKTNMCENKTPEPHIPWTSWTFWQSRTMWSHESLGCPDPLSSFAYWKIIGCSITPFQIFKFQPITMV